MKWNWFRLLGVILLLPLFVVGCQKKEKSDPLLTYSGFAIGTTYLIKIADTSSAIPTTELKKEIDALLRQVDVSMSTFYPDSELFKFNQYSKTDWFPVSHTVYTVMSEALRIARLTNGAFDPTVGAFVDLWGFGVTDRKKQVPSVNTIEAHKQFVGFQKLVIRETPYALKKQDQRIMVDLAAIAKGRSVDLMAELLESKGFENYLIEIGGEVKTKGTKPDHSPWLVAIEKPLLDQRSVQKIVKLNNLSMATSGDYRNYFEVDGKRYSHMLNPLTGSPVENNLASVTIIHESCMTADALATALMVLGAEKGIQLAERFDVAALFISRINGNLKETSSTGFKRFLTQNEFIRK